MSSFSRIIFVDEENTCLSVIAEAVMQRVKKSQPTEVFSRGLVVLYPEPVNSKAEQVLLLHTVTSFHSVACQLKPEEISETTMILTMTEREKEKILADLPQANFVYTLREFAGEQGDMEEPHGSMESFEACYQRICELVTKAAEILYREDWKK